MFFVMFCILMYQWLEAFLTFILKNLYIYTLFLEKLYNKDICHLQLKKRRFERLSSKFNYKTGQ